jgi:hypothetical protein
MCLFLLITFLQTYKEPTIASVISPILSVLWLYGAYRVYKDAESLGVKKGLIKGLGNMDPGMWLICCLLLPYVAYPLYFIKRPKFKALKNNK